LGWAPVTLEGVVSGGVPPYTFFWTPNTGLSQPNNFLTEATPTNTTDYLFTVTDSNDQTASDWVNISVQNPPLVCSSTSIGQIPLNDLGTGFYLGQFQGGLYPNGLNHPPLEHEAEGMERAQNMMPLNTSGMPNSIGKIVLLAIGMSNTTQEFCSGDYPNCDPRSFMGQAAAHPWVNHETLEFVDGADYGQAASAWESDGPVGEGNYDRVRDTVLAPRGLSEAQVQIVWVKLANVGPHYLLPDFNADAFELQESLGNIARTVRNRYPNIKIMFLSSRRCCGYRCRC